MKEIKNFSQIRYDATCRFCTRGIERLRPWLDRREIVPVPFENGAAEPEMRLHWRDGRVFGGAEAMIFLGRLFWYTWPVATLARLPGLNRIAHAGYELFARNRHCFNGACLVDPAPAEPDPRPGWVLLASLVGWVVAIGFLFPVPAWVWMWMLAGALWIGFKAMTFREGGAGRKIHPLFLLWIGTETGPFRYGARRAVTADLPVLSPLLFLTAGALLLFVVLPGLKADAVVGWLGVLAMLCLLHFGVFALLAGIFRRAGFKVEPIMKAPWMAKSLGEFWGPRWNRAFSDWARHHIFRPLVRRWGTMRGTIAGFLASGFAHELVISLPARGGFGLPTLYFLLQAGVLLAQRRNPTLRSRFLTLATVLLPAPLLFHPLFVERVFAPMIRLLTQS